MADGWTARSRSSPGREAASGASTRWLFAAEGAAVLVNDIGLRTGADAAAVAAEIEAAGGIAVADTNSATWDGADAIVQHAIDEFGRLDIVVNNATAARNADLWRVTEEEWDLRHRASTSRATSR